MEPKRWQQVESIYQAALECEPAARPAFLEQACAGDAELCREVESMLEWSAEGDRFLESPAVEVAARALAAESPRLEPGRRLGSYEILSPLAAGGMGEVWRARDTALGRDVAIKVLPPSLARDPGRLQRFEQEARAVGMLNHPNVLAIYAIGKEEGSPYLVTELLEGETLRQRLGGGPLPARKVIDYAVQIARGMAAAHEKGLVHRDLKPENIFVTRDGQVKILDFGLAKLQQPGPDAQLHTAAGIVLGTAGYMSPEQVRGQPADHRSDLFSLGAVLYEMLAGRRAFAGETAVETMNTILREEPPPAGAPAGLERIVRHCLEKSPDERFQSARDLAFQLESAIDGSGFEATAPRRRRKPTALVVLAALIVTVLAGWWLISRRGVREPVSIVVLPFANLSGDPANEYLSDGLTEEIISTLAAIPEMRVVARTSAFQFKGRSADVRTIGRDLNVKTALEGSVRREGQKVRVSAQLVNVSDGLHLWSKMYDREMAGMLEVEQDITRAIVDALKVRLAAPKAGTAETTSIEAHELYLKSRYFWNKMTPADLKKSIEIMEQAIAVDPNYAAAYAGLSDAYGFWIGLELEGPWEQSARARRAAQKALELDQGSAEGHFAMGAILAWADWDWSGSEREFRRALDLKPSLVSARGAYAGLCLGPLRRYEDAMEQFRQALDVDPLSVTFRTFLGQAYVYAGRPDEGIREVRKALEMEPGFPMGGITLALAHLEKSSYLEALQVLQPIRDAAGEIPYYSGLLGYTHAKLGNRAEAERVLEQLKARFTGPWVPPVEVAGIYNGLGDREQALRWLERGCQQRSTMMPFVIDDPRFRNLYSDPRFKAVLGRMGLSR